MLVTMKEILDRACKENYAVAAPNISNQVEVDACISAAEELNAPLILDVHLDNIAGPVKIACPNLFGQWLRMRCIESFVPIAINEDHGASYETAVMNIKHGVTSVMADRSKLPYEENVREVKRVVELAHAAGVSVEAELGHVGTAANYAVDRDAALTDPEEAVRFIQDTGIDCLAISIGTAHGAYPPGLEPNLDFERLAAIKAAVGEFPLVLHGSSGTPDDQLYKACRMGINKVNIATDLSLAGLKAVKETTQKFSPINIASRAFKQKLKDMIPIYGSDGKAWKE